MIDVFVLGVERSATTWISNILEAHPSTCVYMEPLASSTSGFGSWPDRFTRVRDLGTYGEYFREEFEKLKKNKHFFLTNLFDSDLAWSLDSRLASFLSNRLSFESANDFLHLNFHRLNCDFEFKESSSSLTVVKEVRLNHNADILDEINPNSRVIVPFRGYGPVISSIRRYFNKGSLIDLKKDLKNEYGDYKNKKTLFKYWYKSYNNLFETLEKVGANYSVLNHIEAVKDMGIVKEKLEWIGLDIKSNVKKYISSSRKKGKGKHSTKRDPDTLYKRDKESSQKMKKENSFLGKYPDENAHRIVKKYMNSVD